MGEHVGVRRTGIGRSVANFVVLVIYSGRISLKSQPMIVEGSFGANQSFVYGERDPR